jgi:phage terminase large subunit-like protein
VTGRDLARYATDSVAFTDDLIRVNELGQPFRLTDYQRELDRAAFVFNAEGRLGWDTLLDARLKKTAKTLDNARRLVWWGFTQEAPNEILILANDQEQAQSRVFATAARLIRNNPVLAASAVTLDSRRIVLSNGTEIKALASEYAGAAGSNHGLTSWDELWAYTSEGSRRLWEELTPVPTRRNSIRLITTYAGWEGESKLLWELYTQGVGPEEHPAGQAVRIHPTWPLYLNREARLLCLWDHEPRMPWQTPAYYAAQRRTLRAGTYLRLHENRWTTAETTFITPELWDACVDPTLRPLVVRRPGQRVYIGVDASTKQDSSGVVSVYWDGDRLVLAGHRIWQPSPTAPLDLEATIESDLREWCARFDVARILCDPYQLHRSITTLAAAGLPIEEFPQTTGNTTRMGQVLFELLNGRNVALYPTADLRAQALATVAVESSRGWRITKDKASKKIDAIVALSLAAVAAIDGQPATGGGPRPIVNGYIRMDWSDAQVEEFFDRMKFESRYPTRAEQGQARLPTWFHGG